MSERTEGKEPMDAGEPACPRCGGRRPDLAAPCPHCNAPALGPAEAGPLAAAAAAAAEARRGVWDMVMQVRASDIEPYVGLRYLSKLFRLMAVIMIVLLIAEVVTGLLSEGVIAIPTLIGEISRLIVLGSLLWAMGDLAVLLIDIGHDVRATRILLGRQAAHHFADEHQGVPPTKPGAAPPAVAPPVGEKRSHGS